MVYPEEFVCEQPQVTFNVLSSRLRRATTLQLELADYFRERAQVEDIYIKQLHKLHRKTFLSDPAFLGQLEPVWAALHEEIYAVIQLHSDLIQEITNKIEKPLREFPFSNKEWCRLRS
ncbi:hypothetical protein IWQ62_004766, partial [Dispira parvispora]